MHNECTRAMYTGNYSQELLHDLFFLRKLPGYSLPSCTDITYRLIILKFMLMCRIYNNYTKNVTTIVTSNYLQTFAVQLLKSMIQTVSN